MKLLIACFTLLAGMTLSAIPSSDDHIEAILKERGTAALIDIITNSKDTNLKSKARSWLGKLNVSNNPKEREARRLHRQQILSELAAIDLRNGNDTKTKEIRALLGPEYQSPSLKTFLSAHSGKLGSTAYHALDGLLQYHETIKKGEGLSGKTAQEVQEGFKPLIQYSIDGVNPASSIARTVRPIANISYGLLPFAHEAFNSSLGRKIVPGTVETYSPAQQSTLSKTLGGANLAALLASGLYNRVTRKNNTLTPYESYLLSYLNRRHEVPDDIAAYKKTMTITAKIRWLIRVVGLAALPGLLAVITRGKKLSSSPALMAGNLASIADSLVGIYEQYRTQKLIGMIKKITPLIEQELKQKPPTAKEKESDKQDLSFGLGMENLMGMGD